MLTAETAVRFVIKNITLSVDHFCFYKYATDGVDFGNKLITKWLKPTNYLFEMDNILDKL
jgi:hypothetical protein